MDDGPVVDWGGEPIELRPERAALLRRHRTLLVADVHLGKARAFRQQGVPVPGGTTQETLARLDALVRATDAEHVVFLGDLLHSRHAQGSAALDEFARWRAAHASLALTLVRGNHDAHAGDPPSSLGIRTVEEPFALGTLALCHHPEAHAPRRSGLRTPNATAPLATRLVPSFMDEALQLAEPDEPARAPRRAARVPRAGAGARNDAVADVDERPRVAGHVHPCHSVWGRADSLRLPCFHFGERVAVLPAFGAFTGMHAVTRAPRDRLWVVAGDRVVAVP